MSNDHALIASSLDHGSDCGIRKSTGNRSGGGRKPKRAGGGCHDSAAVVDALTVAPGSEHLRAELTAEELHAPTLLDFEMVSALHGLTLGGQLSAVRAQDR